MPSPIVEEFQLSGKQLVSSVRELLHQGNIRRISVRNAEGTTLIEVPLIVGVAGAVLAPVWAALGALAALLAQCTLVVERDADEAPAAAEVAKAPGPDDASHENDHPAS